MKSQICPKIDARIAFLLGDFPQQVMPVYGLVSSAKGVYAQGCMLKGGFLVLEGSLAAKSINRKLKTAHKRLREKLLKTGVLEKNDDGLAFTRPYLFENEYEATSVIVGNNRCRIHDGIWADQQGRTPLENELIGTIELEIEPI